MLTHRGFSAWIHSEEGPVPEYLVSRPDSNNCVNCWIPGKPGSKFTVFWQDGTNSSIASCAYINIDGTHVPGKFLHGTGFSAKSGVRISKDAERPFVFEAVTDEVRDSAANTAKTGTITLEIKRVVLIGTRPSDSAESLTLSKTILEKPKAGEICVGLGQEVVPTQQSPMTYQIAPFPKPAGHGPYPKPSTYVTFKFKYRTLEWLQQQDIATEANMSTALSLIHVAAAPPMKVEDSPQILSSKRAREGSGTPSSPSGSGPPHKKAKSSNQQLLTDISASSDSTAHSIYNGTPGITASTSTTSSEIPLAHSNIIIGLHPASEAEQQMSQLRSSRARGKARVSSTSNSRKASASGPAVASTSALPVSSLTTNSSSMIPSMYTNSFNFSTPVSRELKEPSAEQGSQWMSDAEFNALFPGLTPHNSDLDNHILPMPDGSVSDMTTPSPSF